MKKIMIIVIAILLQVQYGNAQTTKPAAKDSSLYIDVHYLQPGKVTFADVGAAHIKDLATEKKYGVKFIKYWVDEVNGVVYCLSSAQDSAHIRETHRDAHGLLPQEIWKVTEGIAGKPVDGKKYFLDIHQLGAGKVTAGDVAVAHAKDLAVQKKHGVNFINYWVNEATGLVYCLSQASDPAHVINAHREAHGLVPVQVVQVKQGQ